MFAALVLLYNDDLGRQFFPNVSREGKNPSQATTTLVTNLMVGLLVKECQKSTGHLPGYRQERGGTFVSDLCL